MPGEGSGSANEFVDELAVVAGAGGADLGAVGDLHVADIFQQFDVGDGLGHGGAEVGAFEGAVGEDPAGEVFEADGLGADGVEDLFEALAVMLDDVPGAGGVDEVELVPVEVAVGGQDLGVAAHVRDYLSGT